MHVLTSMTGCSVGGSIMLAAMASSIALRLAFSFAMRPRTYQASNAIMGMT
jgi:hypothetical protein